MDNLIFSLNVTMPVFIMMVIGFVLRKLGLVDENYAQKTNRFVFTILLPLVLFKDLAVLDLKSAWDTKFVLFCFIATSSCASFLLASGAMAFWK